MIVFYYRAGCPRCSEARDALQDLAIDCRLVQIEPGEALPQEASAGAALPVLVDDGRPFEGSRAVLAHVDELRSFKEEWYKYQSDVCYCD